MNDTKQCITCNRILSRKDFKHRNVCNSCTKDKQKVKPDHKGIPISDPAHPLHNVKYSQHYKPPQPHDDIVGCITSINDTLSKIMVEIKEVNELMKEFFKIKKS